MRRSETGSLAAVRPALVATLARAAAGEALSRDEAVALLDDPACTEPLLDVAGARRDAHWGTTVTYSPKVFLPVTNLCRDRCTYCTFRKDPGDPDAWTMLPGGHRGMVDARGRALGCNEALMCLGDKPEIAFREYRATLDSLGACDAPSSTSNARLRDRARLRASCRTPTPGMLTGDEMARLRRVNVSLGLMLENVSPRLRERGQVHQWAPDKDPRVRLRMMREAGELRIPFTTGILIGIGETHRRSASIA